MPSEYGKHIERCINLVAIEDEHPGAASTELTNLLKIRAAAQRWAAGTLKPLHAGAVTSCIERRLAILDQEAPTDATKG